MQRVEDLAVRDSAVAATDERHGGSAFGGTSAETLRRETAEQHVVAIFKTKSVLRRFGIIAAPDESVAADDDARTLRGEHGQIGRVVNRVTSNRDSRDVAEFDCSPLTAEHVASDVDEVRGIDLLRLRRVGSLRPFDISADDADVCSAGLHGRLNRVAADRDLAENAVGRVEPDF